MHGVQVEYNILLFSRDEELLEAITAGADFTGDQTKISFQYTVRRDPANISYVEEFDLIIYDLGVVHSSVASAAFDLKRIKSNSSSSPIVLLGERTTLDNVSVQGELKERVDRFVSKPVFSAKLNLTMEILLSKKVADKQAGQRQPLVTSQKKLVLIGGLTSIFILLAVGFYLVQETSLKPDRSDTQLVASDSVVINIDSNENADQSSDVSRLVILAKEAEAAQRIYSPSGDNALHYYALALELDDYNNEAYQGRQRLIEQVRLLLSAKLVDKNIAEAAQLLAVLEHEEPFSDQNRSSRQSLNALSSELAELAASADSVIVTGDTPSMAKTNAAQPSNASTSIRPTTQPLLGEDKSADWQLPEALDSHAQSSPVNQSARRAETLKASRSAVDATQNEAMPTSQGDKAITQPTVAQRNASALGPASLPEKSKAVSRMSSEPLATRQIVKAASVIKPPKIINRVGAEYPPRAYKFDLEGWVEVSYQVSQKGLPINVSIIEGEPKKIFNKAALDALKKWRFEPAINVSTGEPVVSKTNSTRFNFAIDTSN